MGNNSQHLESKTCASFLGSFLLGPSLSLVPSLFCFSKTTKQSMAPKKAPLANVLNLEGSVVAAAKVTFTLGKLIGQGGFGAIYLGMRFGHPLVLPLLSVSH